MFLDLKDIGPEGRSFEGGVPVPEMERYPGESVGVRTAQLVLRVDRREGRLELEGRLVARVELVCGRCLESFEWPFEAPLVLRLLPGTSEEEDAREGVEDVQGDQVDAWRLDGQALDLVRLVQEVVLLQLPLKPICRPGCLGLCPRCGTDRNRTQCGCDTRLEDPRLAPLSELKKRLGSN
jgi:uncharacterized protein